MTTPQEAPTRIYEPRPTAHKSAAEDAPMRIYSPSSASRQAAHSPYSTVLDGSIRKP